MNFTADFFKQAQSCLEEVVRAYRPKLLDAHGDVKTDLKQNKSAVTEHDIELEHLISDALKKFDPAIGIHGEELGREGNEETFWLVDPIDGTENFTRGLPFVYNMATLIDDGEPVYAFVYRIFSDELFTAIKGGGSFKNGRPIHVSQRPIERSFIEIDTTYFGRPEAVTLFNAIEPLIYRLRKIDDFTYAPEGKVDGHIVYKTGGSVWDYPPRALLIAEAGGRVSNIGSDTYDYRDLSLLGTNPLIFDDLSKAITEAVGAKK
jgi:myo-inositol-1(or 4)-monophosphatase